MPRVSSLPPWTALAVAGALAGCRHGTRPTTPTVAAVALAPTRLLWVPVGASQSLHREEDGTTDLVAGTMRVRVRDDEFQSAREQLAAPISFGARVAHGWVYVATDGACLASADFLGPLRRVGDFPDFYQHYRSDGAQSPQRGRVALVDRERVAWMSDGGPFGRITGLGPDRVEQVYFVDERHGAAITDGGVVRCTADGGEHWRVMPTGGVGASHMLTLGPLIQVLAGPWYTLLPGCEVFARASEESRRPDLPAGEVERYDRLYREAVAREEEHNNDRGDRGLRLLLAARDPAWLDLLGGLVRPDGTIVFGTSGGLVSLDADSGRVLGRVATDMSGCAL